MAKYVFTIGFEDSKKAIAFEQSLSLMGLKYVRKDIEGEKVDTTVMPKAETTPKKATPKKAKAETKRTKNVTDGFDTKLYHQIATELGVMGKKGSVYKFARRTVYDGMNEAKNGKLSAKVKKALMAQLLTEAKAKGLQWYIDSVAKAAKAQ